MSSVSAFWIYFFIQLISHEPLLNTARRCTSTLEHGGEANGHGPILLGPMGISGSQQLLLPSKPSLGEALALCLLSLLDTAGPRGGGRQARKHQQVPVSSG